MIQPLPVDSSPSLYSRQSSARITRTQSILFIINPKICLIQLKLPTFPNTVELFKCHLLTFFPTVAQCANVTSTTKNSFFADLFTFCVLQTTAISIILYTLQTSKTYQVILKFINRSFFSLSYYEHCFYLPVKTILPGIILSSYCQEFFVKVSLRISRKLSMQFCNCFGTCASSM